MSRILDKIVACFFLIVFVTLLVNHGAIDFSAWDKAVGITKDAVESEQGQALIEETKETSWNVAEIFIKKFRKDSEKAKEEYNERFNEEAVKPATTEKDTTTAAATVKETASAQDVTLIKANLEAVIDGDTLLVNTKDRKGIKVRLIGVDTPESVHADESKNNQYGTLASDYTKLLLKDTTVVYLQYDEAQQDVYERDLCYVWLKEDVDTSSTQDISNYMLNGILLRNGYAHDKAFIPNVKYIDVFAQLREDAETTKAGLWQFNEFEQL